MPSTKNHTNRIRKGRRQGIPATKGNAGPNKRGVAAMRRGKSDTPRETPIAAAKEDSTIVPKRRVKRNPATAARRGESTTPRDQRARRGTTSRRKSTGTVAVA